MINSQSTVIPATAGIHNHYQRDLLDLGLWVPASAGTEVTLNSRF